MHEPLWKLDDVARAIGAGYASGAPAEVSEVSIDTRTLVASALYFAIKGDRLDGHDFVEQAFEAGALAAVVERGFAASGDARRLLAVDDTLRALNRLGGAARARSGASIVAVTGSAGKTGTKEALRLALSRSGTTHASDKSYNNHWGVPLSLANLSASAEFGVFEVGMNSPGEIEPLARLIRPHVAIVTTVEPVHLEFFDSVARIAEAKAEIFQGLQAGGTAILNKDNPHYELLRGAAEKAGAGRILSFGADPAADIRLLESAPDGAGSAVSADIVGHGLSYRISAPGRHLVQNSLAVLGAVHALGADLERGAAALAEYAVPKGRGERTTFELEGGPVIVVDESYNANPASMRAALAALAQTPRATCPRRIAVLGDMLELGETGPELHAALADPVDAAGVDVVFACGPLMNALFEELPESRRGTYAPSSRELESDLLNAVGPGDVIMVKGSLGSRMGPLVEALSTYLSDSTGRARAD